ncbi:MAG TPA: hypothetical protein VF411_00375 [Bacteroidia bacterium]
MKTIIAIILISLALTGCQGFAYQKELIDNYYLVASDDYEQMSLSYNNSDGGGNFSHLVLQTVFEAKWNDRFIVIKTHPQNLRESLKYSFGLQYSSKIGPSNNFAEDDSLVKIEVEKFMASRNIYGNNKYKYKVTLYYLLDTQKQGQTTIVFLTEEELNKAMEEKHIGKLIYTQYFEDLDKIDKQELTAP